MKLSIFFKSNFRIIYTFSGILALLLYFQNCSNVHFSSPSSEEEIIKNCEQNPEDPDCQIDLKCQFNGTEYDEGDTVEAFQNSSVPFGEICKSEIRVCKNGSFTGSFQFISCDVGVAKSCLFDGKTIKHNDFVIAYQNPSVLYGSSCQSEKRICNNGVLSGSFNYSDCQVGAPKSCLFNGKTVPHLGSVKAFKNSTEPAGGICQSEVRNCNNGQLSGSFEFDSCSVDSYAQCLFNGKTVAHGQRVTAFQSSSVSYGNSCRSESRLCTNGKLSGSFVFASCNVEAAKSCLFNGITVAHGETLTAFQTSSVPFGNICSAEDRTCNNGQLSGSYTFSSCSVGAPRNCSFNGRSIPHGGSVFAFQSSQVPYNQSCQGETRKCFNGSLSGSFTQELCNKGCKISVYTEPFAYPAVPENMLKKDILLTHGQSINLFDRYSYYNGTRNPQCSSVSQVRTCNNGQVTGSSSFQYSVCIPEPFENPGSPLIIDLSSSLENSSPLAFSSQKDGIAFDILGLNSIPKPYFPRRISWYRSSQYAFLVLPNKAGEVKGVDQLFGNNTRGPDGRFADDGYLALAKFDGTTSDGLRRITNPDGLITPADPIFEKLRLWNDRNYDGVSSPDELSTLTEKKLAVIDLNADPHYLEVDQYGNETRLKSVVKTQDGRYHLIFDIWFKHFSLNYTGE